MKPTAITCRAQQAHQLSLAAGALLPNVRNIANIAAAAWGKEALAADKRDLRTAQRHQEAASVSLGLHLELPNENDRRFSENPDRSFIAADADTMRD